MKGKFSVIFLGVLILLLIASFFLSGRPAHSAPLAYSGSVELRSPVWTSRDRLIVEDDFLVSRSFEPNIRYLDLAGNIRFTHPGTPLALFISGEHSFSRGYFVHENELRVGIDLPVGGRCPVTLFSFWERRFDLDVDRVFVGARLGFKGTLD